MNNIEFNEKERLVLFSALESLKSEVSKEKDDPKMKFGKEFYLKTIEDLFKKLEKANCFKTINE